MNNENNDITIEGFMVKLSKEKIEKLLKELNTPTGMNSINRTYCMGFINGMDSLGAITPQEAHEYRRRIYINMMEEGIS